MSRSSSHDIIRQLNCLTECAICADTYHDPRILPCVHTYCLKCINAFCRDKIPKDEGECPLCRNKFEIPDSGVEGLPKNFLVEQLKDVTGGSSSECEGCGSDENKSAAMFCVECSQRLCDTCAGSHRRLRATRTHKMVELSNGDELNKLSATMARSYCDKHEDEVLKYYCFDCKSPLCVTCFVVLHNSHKCSDVNEVADEFRKQMKGYVGNLVVAVSKCRKMAEERKKDKAEFVRRIDEVEREINECAERMMKQMMRQIEQEKQQLLTKVESCKAETVKQIDHVIDEVEQHVAFIESLTKYAEELANKGTAGDVTQQNCNVHNRAVELEKLDVVEGLVSDLKSIDVTFKPTEWSTRQAYRNIIGSVNIRLHGEDDMAYIKRMLHEVQEYSSRNNDNDNQTNYDTPEFNEAMLEAIQKEL